MTEKVQQRELEAQQVKTQQPRNRIQDPSHRKLSFKKWCLFVCLFFYWLSQSTWRCYQIKLASRHQFKKKKKKSQFGPTLIFSFPLRAPSCRQTWTAWKRSAQSSWRSSRDWRRRSTRSTTRPSGSSPQNTAKCKRSWPSFRPFNAFDPTGVYCRKWMPSQTNSRAGKECLPNHDAEWQT